MVSQLRRSYLDQRKEAASLRELGWGWKEVFLGLLFSKAFLRKQDGGVGGRNRVFDDPACVRCRQTVPMDRSICISCKVMHI